MKKALPIFLILTGLALLLGAATFWYDRLTSAEPASLAQNLRDWLTTLFGLGASLKGWLDLLKQDDQQPPAGPTTHGDHSPAHTGSGDIIQTEGGDVYKGEQIIIQPPPEPKKPPNTIGYIPPYRAVTYIPRGVEDDVLAALRRGQHSAIVGVTGAGGLGKTELAKRVQQAAREHFEGVLWVELGGRSGDDVLAELLTALGVRSEPGENRAQRLARLRAAWQGRRLLVVLDDVRRGLLPDLEALLPPPPNAALITSRVREIGPAPRVFPLDEFTPQQARALLESVLGPQAVAAEAQAAETLARRCGYNPLALDIAARRIRQMRGMERPIAAFLQGAQDRLAALSLPDQPDWDLATVIGLSYADLDDNDQRRFRALAVFGAPDDEGFFSALDFSPEAAAAVWDEEPADVQKALTRLEYLSLVQPVPAPESAGRRYRLHDLTAEFAARQLPPDERSAAEARLEEWLAAWFDKHAVPNPDVLQRGLAERPLLLMACRRAAARGDLPALARLTTTPRNWFYNIFRKDWNDWLVWLKQAAAVPDKKLRANVLQAIGDVQQFRDDRDAALESYTQALALFRQIGAKLGEANVLQAIGDVQRFRKETDTALESYTQALALFRQIPNQLGEANVLKAIGDVQQFRDDRDAALESYNQALALFRQIGDKLGEANVLKAIGDVQQFRKETDAALERYQEALSLYRAVGDRFGEANVLQAMGDVLESTGHHDASLIRYHQALNLYREIAINPDTQKFEEKQHIPPGSYNRALALFREIPNQLRKANEANMLQIMGDVLKSTGRPDDALKSYHQALALFHQIGDKLGAANVLQAIGDVQQFRNDRDAALKSYHHALALFRQIGDKLGAANVLQAIGDEQQLRGNRDAACGSYHQALALFRQIGDKLGEASALRGIGDVQQFRDERDAALESYNQALALFHQIGDKLGEANVLQAIGDVQQFRKKTDAALESYHQALALFRQIGDKLGEANVLATLSRLDVAAGDLARAEAHLQTALNIRRKIHTRGAEGTDLGNFAIALLNAGQPEKALGYAQQARAIFAEIGIGHLVEMMDQVAAACQQAASGGQGQ